MLPLIIALKKVFLRPYSKFCFWLTNLYPKNFVVFQANNIEGFEPVRTDVAWNEVSGNNTMLHVVLQLTDINDNAPKFTRDIYEAGKAFL